MQRGHVAPVGSLALAATLAVGAVLVAPDAHATPMDQSRPVVHGPASPQDGTGPARLAATEPGAGSSH